MHGVQGSCSASPHRGPVRAKVPVDGKIGLKQHETSLPRDSGVASNVFFFSKNLSNQQVHPFFIFFCLGLQLFFARPGFGDLDLPHRQLLDLRSQPSPRSDHRALGGRRAAGAHGQPGCGGRGGAGKKRMDGMFDQQPGGSLEEVRLIDDRNSSFVKLRVSLLALSSQFSKIYCLYFSNFRHILSHRVHLIGLQDPAS